MRRSARLPVLLLGALLAACTDGTGPDGPQGLPLQFTVVPPAGVSAAETTALQNAFDQVDTYYITVRDSAGGSVILVDTATVAAGLSQHRFDFELSSDLAGLKVEVSVVGLDGTLELYRASSYATVQSVTGSPTPVVLPVRYTGPGVRGTVTDEAGVGVANVSVGLYQGMSLIGSPVVTESDGSYLFLNVTPDLYSVEPTPPSGYSCPVGRAVDVQSGEALVADFLLSTTPCQIDLLVLEGGDFDDTNAVASMFASTPGVTTDTYFFVSQTPGLSTLNQYDVVLLFTNGIFDETTALGTELKQYVDAGGNLVIGSFYWQGRSDAGFGSPGWAGLETIDPFTSDVDPFTGHGGATYQINALSGTPVSHALTLGVSTITSIAGFSAGVLAKPSATVLASWSDGAPLIGYRVLGAGQRIVAISLFPGASVPTDADGDVQVMWENAVTWAGQAGGPVP